MSRGERGGGSGWLALLIGGLVVAIAIIGIVLWSSGAPSVDRATDVSIDVDMPSAPRLPDTPTLPPVEPPTVPNPTPPPGPVG